MSAAKPTSRQLKRKVLSLLQSDTFDESLDELTQMPARQVINPLFSFLLSKDEETRWRATTAMGAVVAALADEDMESARVIMRRLMWSLNDESGGIGWGAPEAMGEIIACHEGIAKEYASVLISYIWEDGNFLEYEPLRLGAVWAVARVAQVRPDLVKGAVPHLVLFLNSSDATVRALAAMALGFLAADAARPQLELLVRDDTEVSLYLDRTLARCTVSDVAKVVLVGVGKKEGG